MRMTAAVAALTLLAGTAAAQVRTELPSSFVGPMSPQAAQMLFGRDGYFMIAGGVLLAGSASFIAEARDDAPVPAGAVHLVATHDGGAALSFEGAQYPVRMPAGLACPLARFVARDGTIAYTVPKYMDDRSRRAMLEAGIDHHRVAHEFAKTRFEALLRAADFADTVPLPADMSARLTASINQSNDIDGFVIDASDSDTPPIGSLINTDAQVRYHVYLDRATRTVEIGGVPLRYFWELNRAQSAAVFAVAAFAQNWAPGTTLSDFSAAGARPTQYDIVNFYQVAGLFKQMHRDDAGGFSGFAAAVCGG